jgi:uncharacterized repeat protein (TIGR02543 family)
MEVSMKRNVFKKAIAAAVAMMIIFGSGILVPAQAEDTAYTVTFDVNGGTGTAPVAETASTSNNDTIVLPSYTGTKNGYTFAGWAVTNNLVSSTYYSVYPAGTTLTVSKDTQLYAVWTTSTTATFYIRLDGTTPYEPSQYSSSSYTQGITIANVVKANTWVCDTTGTKVLADLNAVPTDAQIKAVYPAYDSTSQYVTWYVIKYAGSWHVDGVIQNKAEINLTYDGNGDGDVSNVPLGSQYYASNSVTVGTTGGNAGAVTVPTRTGYTFNGWNTAADGSGTSYASGSTFTINQATVLYAQWIPNEGTSYTVQWIDASDQSVIKSTVRYGATGNTASVYDSDKSLAGYTYEGDTYTGTALSGTIAGDGSLVLKIYFEKTPYSVTYENDDNTVLQTSSEYTGSSIASYSGATPVKDADSTYTYAFSGWELTSGTEGSNSTVGTTDLVYTAVYEPTYINYTVTYDLNGGTEAEGTDLVYTNQHQGDATPTIADPVKASDGTYEYVFAGWSPAVADTVTGDVTYTAQWTAVKIMTVTAESVSGVYNGTAYTLPAAQADTDGAVIEYSTDNGETWSTELPTRTDAGTTNVLIRANKEGYTEAETSAAITVFQRTVVLTSESSSKSYDGTALTDNTVNVTGEGFVSGQGAAYTFTGTQTDVGSSANAFTYVLENGTLADNYSIVTDTGTLTVTEARPTTPVTDDDTDSSSTTPVTDDDTDSSATTVTTDTSSTAAAADTSSASASTDTFSEVRPSTPDTGDQTNAPLYAGMVGISAAAVLILLFIKHRYAE